MKDFKDENQIKVGAKKVLDLGRDTQASKKLNHNLIFLLLSSI